MYNHSAHDSVERRNRDITARVQVKQRDSINLSAARPSLSSITFFKTRRSTLTKRMVINMQRIKGIIPAVFTPLQPNGKVNLRHIKPICDFLIQDNISAVYVCGSTGEGPLLTTQERQKVSDAYIDAIAGRVPVIVQIGHSSIKEAVALAKQAAQSGADAISAIPPNYFPIDSLDTLIDCVAEMASAAPDLPFYYYHIPMITGVDFDMLEFLKKGQKNIANLRGIKYTKYTIFEMQSCLELQNGRFEIFFGSDEMMLSAFAAGVRGVVGSTYNFAAPLYYSIIRAFENNDMDKARDLQSHAVAMVRVFYKYRGQAAIKATMKLIGLDCGPSRLPHKSLTLNEIDSLRQELQRIGFFEWARRES